MLKRLKIIIKKFYIQYQSNLRLKRISSFIKNGQIPWSLGYDEYKWQQIEQILSGKSKINNFKFSAKVRNFGLRIDERIVEYPWIFANLNEDETTLLDAGSTFNYEMILKNEIIKKKHKTIITYYPEKNNFNEYRISYVYSDLREIPIKDNYFEEIVCQSTLEHIDMNNSIYGYTEASNMANSIEKSYEYLKVIKELNRVLKNNGVMLITVPFGVFENHGFFQQFDKEMVDKITDELAGFGKIETAFFKYHFQGWEFSDYDSCKMSISHNPHTGDGKLDDYAAHSRAICCIKFIKN